MNLHEAVKDKRKHGQLRQGLCHRPQKTQPKAAVPASNVALKPLCKQKPPTIHQTISSRRMGWDEMGETLAKWQKAGRIG
jgi:hypothetical protein